MALLVTMNKNIYAMLHFLTL